MLYASNAKLLAQTISELNMEYSNWIPYLQGNVICDCWPRLY